jgi:DNA-binding winged helix-turn-helix (wHTH) protein
MGQPVALTPKAFQLLELLLRRRPAVVSKQEI